jgi:hypothetical protein
MDIAQLADADLIPTATRGQRLILANAVNRWRQASFAESAGINRGRAPNCVWSENRVL